MKRFIIILYLTLLWNVNLFSQSKYPSINLFAETLVENSNHLIYVDNDIKFRTNTSFNFGIEGIVFGSASIINFGGGILYQLPLSIVGQDGGYSFIPMFVFSRIKVFDTDFFTTTLQIRTGYNFLITNGNYLGGYGNFNGGLYYSLGSILTLENNIQLRLFYSVNYGKYKTNSTNYLIKNNQFSIGLGYGFNL